MNIPIDKSQVLVPTLYFQGSVGTEKDLPKDAKNGDVYLIGNITYLYYDGVWDKIGEPYTDDIDKPLEMKVYYCPNCNNTIHYKQEKCEYCKTVISWV